MDPERLVFIDETWTATNMARTHGRCAKGQRLRMGFPHSHRKTTTLVAGLRLSGMVAPMVLDGPINGDWFEAYVDQVLVPTLRPGDIVIMDNLSSHKRLSVKLLIEAAGATWHSCRPTAQTSTQSRKPSQNSKPISAASASAPSLASGT
jgi:hypothetical protein